MKSFLAILVLLLGVIPLSQAQECTVEAGVDQSICIESIGPNGFQLIGNSTSSFISWEAPNGTDFDFSDRSQEVTFVTGTFEPGVYTFNLVAFCGGTSIIFDQVTITLESEPIVYVRSTENSFSFTSATLCLDATVNALLDFEGVPGILPPTNVPEGSVGWWFVNPNQTNFGNIEFEVISETELYVEVTNPGQNFCPEENFVEVVYNLETPGGCTTAYPFKLYFRSAEHNVPPVVSVGLCVNPGQKLNVTLSGDNGMFPFPGCLRFANPSGLNGLGSSFQQIGGPTNIPPQDMIFNYDPELNAYLESVTLNNLCAGTYNFLYRAFGPTLLPYECPEFDQVYTVNILESPFEYTLPDFADYYCGGFPSQATFSMTTPPPAGYSFGWRLVAPEGGPTTSISPNGLSYSITDVPQDEFFAVVLDVTNPDNCLNSSAAFFYPEPNIRSQGEVRISCSSQNDFVKLIDFMNPNYIFPDGTEYCDFYDFMDCEWFRTSVTVNEAPYDLGWTVAEWHPSLGFSPFRSGVYRFTVEQILMINGEMCMDTEEITVIVGPNGAIAEAGTNAEGCDFITLSAAPINDLNGLTLEWIQVGGPAGADIDLVTNGIFNPIVSNLIDGETYTFRFRISLTDDPTCKSEDDVFVKVNCECPRLFEFAMCPEGEGGERGGRTGGRGGSCGPCDGSTGFICPVDQNGNPLFPNINGSFYCIEWSEGGTSLFDQCMDVTPADIGNIFVATIWSHEDGVSCSSGQQTDCIQQLCARLVCIEGVATLVPVDCPEVGAEGEGGRGEGRSAALSNDETALASSIELLPNPAKGSFFLDLPSSEVVQSLEILDLSGKLLLSRQAIGPREEIEIDFLSSGLYLVRLKVGEETVVKKLVKQ
ncbi:MAG: T9SS type A sorting domain-containing protein [Bacteroidota bacterium]